MLSELGWLLADVSLSDERTSAEGGREGGTCSLLALADNEASASKEPSSGRAPRAPLFNPERQGCPSIVLALQHAQPT